MKKKMIRNWNLNYALMIKKSKKSIPKLKNLLSDSFDPTDLNVSSALSLMKVTIFSSSMQKKEIFEIKKINLEIQYDFSDFSNFATFRLKWISPIVI